MIEYNKQSHLNSVINTTIQVTIGNKRCIHNGTIYNSCVSDMFNCGIKHNFHNFIINNLAQKFIVFHWTKFDIREFRRSLIQYGT